MCLRQNKHVILITNFIFQNKIVCIELFTVKNVMAKWGHTKIVYFCRGFMNQWNSKEETWTNYTRQDNGIGGAWDWPRDVPSCDRLTGKWVALIRWMLRCDAQLGVTFIHMRVDQAPHRITKLVREQRSDWTSRITLTNCNTHWWNTINI